MIKALTANALTLFAQVQALIKAFSYKTESLCPKACLQSSYFLCIPMSLKTLSKPALEALLAYHVEVARCIEEELESEREACNDAPIVSLNSTIVEQSPELLGSSTAEQPIATPTPRFPFVHPDAQLTNSRPSTPVNRRPSTSPSTPAAHDWPDTVTVPWRFECSSPSPTPRHSRNLKRKRAEEDPDDHIPQPVRVHIRIDPGWPRGFIRTPTRKRRVWNKENEACGVTAR
ncbi:hypothetical protein R3P38DRAFT_2877047 [Favolaschia claudopus]|uniref:Uncharacterized protein n=1 Tax=Favolaschia claudopus TaxID=2862362 RepID=A0AAW0D3T4_9AGAR